MSSNATPLDVSKWAVVAHKDDSGFGRQAQDMRAVLGIDRQIVIPSERLWDKELRPPLEVLLKPDDPEERVREVLNGLQGIVFYERHSWHPKILQVARELGVRSICVPNWEWFNGDDQQWDLCDLLVTSSHFSLSVARKFGRRNSVCLPWTLDLNRFTPRNISGCARIFVHNAGIVDRDDRKGTRDTINAFKRVKGDVSLIVRMQKETDLPKLDSRIDLRIGNLSDPAELYAEADVAIQPSKMEGNGFMVLEPVCSGMPVISLDYPPMNEFVRQPEMRVKKQWFKRKAFPTAWVKHAHLRLPDESDLVRKIEWCAGNDVGNVARDNRAWAESTFRRETLRDTWYAAMKATLGDELKQYVQRTSSTD